MKLIFVQVFSIQKELLSPRILVGWKQRNDVGNTQSVDDANAGSRIQPEEYEMGGSPATHLNSNQRPKVIGGGELI